MPYLYRSLWLSVNHLEKSCLKHGRKKTGREALRFNLFHNRLQMSPGISYLVSFRKSCSVVHLILLTMPSDNDNQTSSIFNCKVDVPHTLSNYCCCCHSYLNLQNLYIPRH